MYIYSVTHLPTRDFYIGFSQDSKSKFNPTIDIDPENVFKDNGTNGSVKISSLEKKIVRIVNSVEEAKEFAKSYTGALNSDFKFLGAKGAFVKPTLKAEIPYQHIVADNNVEGPEIHIQGGKGNSKKS